MKIYEHNQRVYPTQYAFDIKVFQDGNTVKAIDAWGNVIAEGALGTDDASVLQKAVESTPEYGIVCVRDTLNLEGGITLKEHITLTGPGKLVAKTDANLDYVIKLPQQAKHIRVDGITIDGNKDNGNANVSGILVEAGTPNLWAGWSKITDCVIGGCNYGVYLKGYSDTIWEKVWHMRIMRNWFGGSGNANNINIRGELSDCNVIQGNAIEDAGTGVYLDRCRGANIAGNWFDDHDDYGIYFAEPPSEFTSNCIVNGNYFTDSGVADSSIYIGFRNTQNFVSNNQITYVNKYGIHVLGRRNSIVGNTILGKPGALRAIFCETDGKLGVISANKIKENFEYGIYLSVGTTYSLIIGNHIEMCDSGIYFNGSNSHIIGNLLYGNTTQASIVNTNGVVSNNYGYTTEAKGAATISSGNTSVTVAHGLISEPTTVQLAGSHSEVKDAYVSAKDATNITITVDAAVSADRVVYWKAEC